MVMAGGTRDVPDELVAQMAQLLRDPSTSLPNKYRVLFALRNASGRAAQNALALALSDGSALLRHEVAYCLGQRQDPAAVELLKRTLEDKAEHPMVRHEAGEALGAIGSDGCLEAVASHSTDPCLEVAETCQLALQRLEHYSAKRKAQQQQGQGEQQGGQAAAAAAAEDEEEASPYLSVDPAPAAPAGTPVAELRRLLLDPSARILDRYSAMFALRNRGGPDAVEALGDAFDCESALLKHEVAYVLGQMQDAGAVQVLRRVLEDLRENAMVRHEAAEALGSIADPACVQLLQQYVKDQEPIVAHSCEIALDMLEFERSGQFDYMDISSLLAPGLCMPACQKQQQQQEAVGAQQ